MISRDVSTSWQTPVEGFAATRRTLCGQVRLGQINRRLTSGWSRPGARTPTRRSTRRRRTALPAAATTSFANLAKLLTASQPIPPPRPGSPRGRSSATPSEAPRFPSRRSPTQSTKSLAVISFMVVPFRRMEKSAASEPPVFTSTITSGPETSLIRTCPTLVKAAAWM